MYEKTTLFQKLVRWRTAIALGLGLLLLVAATPGLTRLVAAQTPPVTAVKTASPDQVPTGSIVQYTVIFSNSSGDPVDLTNINDTLPAGFSFLSMAAESDIGVDPSGTPEHPIWAGPHTVLAGGALDLIYNVWVDAPPSVTPYVNHVEADLSTGDTIFADANVTVLGPNLTGTKVPSTTTIPDRDPLNYTVMLTNNGSGEATIDTIVDTLPGQFEFLAMVSGPLPDPVQTGNTLTWSGPFSLPVGESLTFIYRVKADGTVGQLHTNSVTATYNGLVAGPFQAQVLVTIGWSEAFLPVVIKTPIPPPPQPVVRKLAYETKPGDNYEVYSVEVDGTDVVNISNRSAGDLNPDWSPDGTRVAWEHYGGNAEIYVANADGTSAQNVTNHDGDDKDPMWSPDGTRILFRSNRDGRWDIFTMNTDGTNQHKLTGDRPCQSTLAKWSPNGTKIGFICGLETSAEVYVMNADGTNHVRLTDDSDEDAALNWSPDNTTIVYVRVPIDDDSEIWVVNVSSVARSRLTTNGVDDFSPMYSPDGSKILFTHEYASSQVTVMNADGTGITNLSNSSAGDFIPQWSPDGAMIAFVSNRDGNKELYVMNANGSGQFRLSNTTSDEVNFDWWPIVP